MGRPGDVDIELKQGFLRFFDVWLAGLDRLLGFVDRVVRLGFAAFDKGGD